MMPKSLRYMIEDSKEQYYPFSIPNCKSFLSKYRKFTNFLVIAFVVIRGFQGEIPRIKNLGPQKT